MTINKELQKQYAVDALRKLGVYVPYVNAYKVKRQRVCEFANFGGFFIDEDSALYENIKSIEERTGCMVYAVTRTIFDGMEMCNFLLVSDCEEDMPYTVQNFDGKSKMALAWVENLSWPDGSEMGTIGIQSFGGGIRRVW